VSPSPSPQAATRSLCVTAGAVPGPLATPAAFVSRYHAAAASLSVPHCYYPFYAAFKL